MLINSNESVLKEGNYIKPGSEPLQSRTKLIRWNGIKGEAMHWYKKRMSPFPIAGFQVGDVGESENVITIRVIVSACSDSDGLVTETN